MKNKKIVWIVVFLFVAVLSVVGYETYSRYVGSRAGEADVTVAKWAVKVEGETLTQNDAATFTKTLTWLDSITNDVSEYVAGGKIAPSLYADTSLTIDPATTEVAIDFYVKIAADTTNLNNSNIKVDTDNTTAGMCSDGTSTNATECGAATETWTAITLTPVTEGDRNGYLKGTIQLPGTIGNKTAMVAANKTFINVRVKWDDVNTTVGNTADTETGIDAPTSTIDFDVIVEQKVAA